MITRSYAALRVADLDCIVGSILYFIVYIMV